MRGKSQQRATPAVAKVVAYARVSTKEQDKEGFSIPAQQKLLKAYATTAQLTIVKEFIDVETAKMAGRTNFLEMVDYLKKHPDVRAVLVEKTDRLYRNLRDWVTLDDLDIEIHLVKEGIVLSDDSRSSEKFVHGIKVLMAKNYVDNLSEEARKGMQEKAEQGIWPSSAPIGYRNVVGSDGRKTIEVDPTLGPIVSQLFGWYAGGGVSIDELTEKARNAGLVNRLTGSTVGKSRIHHILRNRIYSGDFVWKERVYTGKHAPLITRELWVRVQQMLDGRNLSNLRRVKHEFAFSGAIKCGHCGCAFVGELKKGRYVYYHCTGFKGDCGERYVREEVLEEKFREALARLKFGEDELIWLKEALRDSHADQRKEHDAAVIRLQGEYDRIQKRLHAMYMDKLDGRIDSDFFDRTSAQWRDEQATLLRELSFHQAADQSYLEDGIRLLDLADRAQEIFEKRSVADKKRLLKFALSNCTWKKGHLSVTYREPFDIIAKIDAPPFGSGGGKRQIPPERSEWWARLDSNQEPDRYERPALTIELQAPAAGNR